MFRARVYGWFGCGIAVEGKSAGKVCFGLKGIEQAVHIGTRIILLDG